MQTYTLAQVNGFLRDEFVRVIGPVFEHSPWIAEATWPQRPFTSREKLHWALCDTLRDASEEKQLALICAHPDLVGRAVLAGALTPASTSEQASAGLDKLTRGEMAAFQKFNQAYREKFGFPFVICAWLNRKEAILNGFRTRMSHSRAEEIKAALEEIFKIAAFRLKNIVEG
jgi:2-oxo-4-hydroxy-4-carboxy-5-ureidoimidazoline decarboxylase